MEIGDRWRRHAECRAAGVAIATFVAPVAFAASAVLAASAALAASATSAALVAFRVLGFLQLRERVSLLAPLLLELRDLSFQGVRLVRLGLQRAIGVLFGDAILLGGRLLVRRLLGLSLHFSLASTFVLGATGMRSRQRSWC
ncbi:MAG TPA: hypothetical protein VG274_01865 [Rhizomicrobium sp.]|jgi:hypothetical protein|nr:hypothetical protein [Rhizomicrobium sp.]